MNMEKLIEKLKKEYGENGNYYVLKMNYEDFKKTYLSKQEIMGYREKIEEYMKLSNKEYEIFQFLIGFIYGLNATDFIIKDEKELLIENLINYKF